MGWALSRQSLSLGGRVGLTLDGQLLGSKAVDWESGFPTLVPAAQGSRPAPCPGHRNHSSVLFNCTLQCIQAHTQLEPVLQPMVWVSCSFCSPLLPGDPRA